eukprot:3534440-Alexandrium_andersonii.AAC.1
MWAAPWPSESCLAVQVAWASSRITGENGLFGIEPWAEAPDVVANDDWAFRAHVLPGYMLCQKDACPWPVFRVGPSCQDRRCLLYTSDAADDM